MQPNEQKSAQYLMVAMAMMCHEANRAYCAFLGDTSQPSWKDASDWQKRSAVQGVQHALTNPDATPEQMHESWLAGKAADGWVFGEVKDAEKKTHPCMVPYDQLPADQRAKDYLFLANVRTFPSALAVAMEGRKPAAPVSSAAPTPTAPSAVMLPVKYIGRREQQKENIYGTGLVFSAGETKLVPVAKAQLMVGNHPDVWAMGNWPIASQSAAKIVQQQFAAAQSATAVLPGESPRAEPDVATEPAGNPPQDSQAQPPTTSFEEAQAAQQAAEVEARAEAERKAAQKRENAELDREDTVRAIDSFQTKEEVENWARINFGHELDKRHNLDALKYEAKILLDRFGLADLHAKPDPVPRGEVKMAPEPPTPAGKTVKKAAK